MREGCDEPAVFAVGPVQAGGMGRLMVSTGRQWRNARLRPPMRLVDSYGRRNPQYFARALAVVGWNGLRRRIALLHVHMAMHGSIVRKSAIIRLGSLLRIPVVLHLHGSRLDELYPQRLPFTRALLRGVLRRAAVVVVPGRYWHDVLVKRIGVDASRVRVVPSGVFGPERPAPRPSSDVCCLQFLGALVETKGLYELFQALAAPEIRDLRWRLRIAGAGDPTPFAEQCRALGISQKVEFRGLVTEAEVKRLLAETDVFVQVSHGEGLSIALLEAMSHGCAIVATSVGATPEAVTDGESGLLVPPRAVELLRAVLLRLVSEPELRASLGDAARRRWEREFQIAAHCARLSELYREVTGLEKD